MTPLKTKTARGKQAQRWLAGRPGHIDAAPVRAFITDLRDEGFGPDLIGLTAGVSGAVVHRILQGTYPTCQTRVGARIMAVTRTAMYAQASGGHLVPAIGVRRRIDALGALGWSYADIGVVYTTARGRSVHAHTRAHVLAVYDRLSMTVGPSARARLLAHQKGFLPPLAWDDETIDDPNTAGTKAAA
jgi:hypothetical protein